MLEKCMFSFTVLTMEQPTIAEVIDTMSKTDLRPIERLKHAWRYGSFRVLLRALTGLPPDDTQQQTSSAEEETPIA